MALEEPSEAYLVTRSGERIPCLLERSGPRTWQAVPARDVEREEIAEGYVDVLPAGAEVNFVVGIEEV
jgi:hypothetical protein